MSPAPERAAFVREGLRLYNAGRYWEAHEALEQVWRGAPEAERALWQGLIQAAAALWHRERGNAHGVRVVGRGALEKLAAEPPPGFPVETARFAAQLRRCLEQDDPAPRMELTTGAGALDVPERDRP